MTGETQEIPAERGVVNVFVERKESIFLPETRKQASYDHLGRVLTLPSQRAPPVCGQVVVSPESSGLIPHGPPWPPPHPHASLRPRPPSGLLLT